MKIILSAQCEGGHSQTITYEGDWVGMEYVEQFAKMLDGSMVRNSLVGPLVATYPAAAKIGKCGKCGTPIVCSITKVNAA